MQTPRTEDIDVSFITTGPFADLYSSTYERYLDFFKRLSFSPHPCHCHNVPKCWAPLVLYLGHAVISAVYEPKIDPANIDWKKAYKKAEDKRRIVEISSTCRPELVHALYLVDTAWPCRFRYASVLSVSHSFPVTCNGSFFRPEVRYFMELVRCHRPTKRKCVIVSCSADKPYPAIAHTAVRNRLPEDWYIIVVSGTLGLSPEDLWPAAPQYDAGFPNPQRVVDTVAWYFNRHPHDRIVVYSDFYAKQIKDGLGHKSADYIFGAYPRDTYENVELPEHLDRLESALRA